MYWAELAAVDVVTVFHEDTPAELIRALAAVALAAADGAPP